MGVFSFYDLLYTRDAPKLRFYYLLLLFHTLSIRSLRVAAPSEIRAADFAGFNHETPRYAPLSVAMCQLTSLFIHHHQLYTIVYMVVTASF
jgi:hypothetical protein